jgi:hypothetical protein
MPLRCTATQAFEVPGRRGPSERHQIIGYDAASRVLVTAQPPGRPGAFSCRVAEGAHQLVLHLKTRSDLLGGPNRSYIKWIQFSPPP